MREARGRAVKVISALLEHLPGDNNYQLVFMHRDLPEILASQAKMLERRGIARGGEADESLQKHYETHLRKVKYFLSHTPGFSVLDVRYADALSDPKTAAKRLNAFLGGTLDEARMADVVDRKRYRNRAS